jgi:HD-GYP domain-containing protein (c-di-GMP phosphodiesterase class II)
MDLDELVGEAREREPQPMATRERTALMVSTVALVSATAGLAALLPNDRHPDVLIVVALVAMFAVAARVEFEIGQNNAMPGQLVFLPMLFLAPLSIVPLLIGVAFILGELPEFLRRKTHPDRWLYCLSDAWFAVGPVLVIGLLAPGDPRVDDLWVYALAVAAQFATSALYWAILLYVVRGENPLATLKIVFWDERINVVLSPIALVVAAVAAERAYAVLAIAPLLWLLHAFSKERSERYAAALELHQTYRGTVMVLADVVEADDNYTADHCRSVVDLAVATAEVLHLDHKQIQELETAALMHDVGKIAIPKEILNKPAKLTEDEFELMKSHTIEGQALLDRVGGRLARVGEIVRSCHERWDGRGYPDGLRGEEIPLAARIVFCCDAYSAMTTDRPYRAATTPEAAIAELRANSGTQFEPRVVEAVCQVAASDLAREEQPYADAVRAVLAASNAPLPRAHTA